MLIFLSFILGFLFAQYIIPLLDSLCSIALTKIEVTKGKYAIQTTEINKKIREISDNNDEGFLQPVIGFQCPDPEEEFDDL